MQTQAPAASLQKTKQPVILLKDIQQQIKAMEPLNIAFLWEMTGNQQRKSLTTPPPQVVKGMPKTMSSPQMTQKKHQNTPQTKQNTPQKQNNPQKKQNAPQQKQNTPQKKQPVIQLKEIQQEIKSMEPLNISSLWDTPPNTSHAKTNISSQKSQQTPQTTSQKPQQNSQKQQQNSQKQQQTPQKQQQTPQKSQKQTRGKNSLKNQLNVNAPEYNPGNHMTKKLVHSTGPKAFVITGSLPKTKIPDEEIFDTKKYPVSQQDGDELEEVDRINALFAEFDDMETHEELHYRLQQKTQDARATVSIDAIISNIMRQSKSNKTVPKLKAYQPRNKNEHQKPQIRLEQRNGVY